MKAAKKLAYKPTAIARMLVTLDTSGQLEPLLEQVWTYQVDGVIAMDFSTQEE